MTDDSASKKTYKQLVDFGLDKHGFYGLIYSSDNGANYKLLVGTQGRIFYPEDARNFWPYLKDFVSEQLASAISLDWNEIKNKPDVALKSDLPVVPTDLVHTAELEQARADITKAAQTASEAVTLAKSAKVTIDTSNIYQIKKPSEYSEGFSHELKRVAVMIPDRSDLIENAQAGTIGILSTVSYGGYAHQTLKVLDSQRPMTFIRNGSVDTWYPWETVTTTITVD